MSEGPGDSEDDVAPANSNGRATPELTPTQNRIKIFIAEARQEIEHKVGRFKVEVPGDEPFLWIIGSGGQRLWAQLSDNSTDARLVIGDELADE